jgi:16S rRNA (uracil1498-N3)-methyltransferase
VQLFYDPDLQPGLHRLAAEEARHAVRVLRKRPGDWLDLVDGRGGWFRGEIVEAGKQDCTLRVEAVRREDRRAACHLTLAVGPTKSSDRLEWFVEKAVELGVDRIVPILCAHGERRKLRTDRLYKVAVAAMKQSLRAWLPQIDDLVPVEQWLAQRPPGPAYIAWIDDTVTEHLLDAYAPGTDATVLIGPEGGFAPDEVAAARTAGCRAVHLGAHRLRTETAALAAVAALAFANR